MSWISDLFKKDDAGWKRVSKQIEDLDRKVSEEFFKLNARVVGMSKRLDELVITSQDQAKVTKIASDLKRNNDQLQDVVTANTPKTTKKNPKRKAGE